MSVRLLIGRSGSGKTSTCLDEIREKLAENPEGHPLIYLVPDQMTFLSEYQLINTPGLGGMIRAQVFSFTRLAWRVLQETGGISRYHLNSTGINMLIQKILEEKKEEFKLFGRAADKTGFISQMEQMLVEFKRYCVQPEELIEQKEQLSDHTLQDKLHDLQLIYEGFEAGLSNKYVDTEDYFRLLSEKISQSTYLQAAEIYIDGFYSFTPQEYMVIEQLMKQCKQVTITLTLERSYRNQAPDDLHLFRLSGENCRTLYEIATVNKIPVEEVMLDQPKRWGNEALQHLEAHFDSRPARTFNKPNSIYIAQAVNRRSEIEGIARNIKRLVSDNGYRYRDIALLMRNGQDYHELIETIFRDYQIPYFMDQKRTMLNHPLVELIRSVLEILNGNWRYEPVFRAIKTELLFPLGQDSARLREQMDSLENYVLAYGIKGDKWTKRERWIYRRIRGLEYENIAQTDREKRKEQELNELRLMVTAPILRLSRRLKKAGTGRLLGEALYLFLEELDIPAKLEKWKFTEEEKGNLVKAREHDQAWNSIIDILDQFVEILGEEEFTLQSFSKILDAGLEALRFSLVPPAIDQVLAGDLEKSRFSEVKAAFVIGLNEGVLPAKFTDDGILADVDREQLLMNGLKMAHSSKTRLLDEEFIAYKAFVTPSECLYISYPLANEEGKALIPSLYIKRLQDFFPNHHELLYMADPSELADHEQLEYISHRNRSLSYLTAQLQLKKRNYPLADFWWDVYNWYVSGRDKERAILVLSSLDYKNPAKPLSEQMSQELYGDVIQASVSRMELFQGCPFSHFAQHGLRLKDRRVFRLEAPDIGDLFHSALKFIAESVMNNHLTWADLTKEQSAKLAKAAVEALAPRLQNEILLSSNRHAYIKRKLEQIITRASMILSEHAKVSGFSPVGLELGFGPRNELPPLSFQLRNGTKMELVGRIDRVDKAEAENGVYLRVLDYKSSTKELNLGEVYYGMALQMLTYLDIIMTHSKSLVGADAIPAGVFYFHVHNPMISSNEILTLDAIEEKIFKKFKMNGLVLGDENAIRLMDLSLDSGASDIVPAEIKKDGTLSKRSKTASIQEFTDMREFVRQMYVKTGNAITKGDVQIAPYKLKDKTACTFCSYKSVCQFDESMEDNQYRLLVPRSREEALELMRKEVAENGDKPNTTEA
ncbi:helicase-exonuclease AddAB subunit AddB [Bacillus tuaregi]|uniref:helicase-exonuclease AddAB subunit AddB n=1 Tax=Bacillus tuaregi TaxID=1816695 RepID=UPI0008F8545E|nr:helicase-exonuclease AddAB subunit AddB [Bacillus tuaregi]